MSKGYVYFLFNNVELVYVGKSVSEKALRGRLKAHELGKVFTDVKLLKFDTVQDIDVIEVLAIGKYNPKYNIDCNRGSATCVSTNMPDSPNDINFSGTYSILHDSFSSTSELQELRNTISRTKTQEACLTAKEYFSLLGTKKKQSQAGIVKVKGNKVSLILLKNAIYIYKNNKMWFDELLDGNTIYIKNNHTTRLDVIVQHLKEESKSGIKVDKKIEVSESFLDDEFVTNGKKLLADSFIREAESKFGMSIEDISKMFYAMSKGDI